jgi:hypothetical protein
MVSIKRNGEWYQVSLDFATKVYMYTPAVTDLSWSLSALLEVMRKLNATTTLQIIGNSTFLRIKDNGVLWQKDIHVKNPMDAVYGGMLWLFEQGLIKKGEQDG